jgi:glucose/arabinose dehydrogenase
MTRARRITACLAIAGTLVACEDESSGPGDKGPFRLVNAFPSLTFARPTDIQNAGDGTDRLFVTEQTGRILVFPNDAGVAAYTVFLDLTAQVLYENFSELGLLGIAFHPGFENNGYFFVHYSTGAPGARRGRVSRFQVSGDPDVADPASEKILLDFADDYPNHNGGGMCFGTDGYLYVGIGDEGGAGDTDENAQDRSRIFGKILRIDVDQNVNTPPYHGIPPDNPYAGNTSGFREDIWAYGLRNPWRVTFDGPTGRLVAGDVGQRTWEEVDLIEKGGNYGWDCREGRADYNEADDASSPLCAGATGFKEPIAVYGRSEGSSVTGGYVYRGARFPSLVGRYIYGDFGSGRIWALNFLGGSTALLTDSDYYISTFGVTEDDEVLIASYFADGTPAALYQLSSE